MDTKTLKEKTSRVAKGAAENNRLEVREIINTAVRYADGICVVTDREGNKIYVDTLKGVSGIIKEAVINGSVQTGIDWCPTGETSSKDNGYVYTPISVIGLNGRIQSIPYGTHTLVGMLSHTVEFDQLVEDGKTPELNHKNNRKWDNKAVNGEWTTKGGNTRHGKIVSSLQYYYPDQYSHIENNLGETEFIVLDKGLSVRDIERYCSSIGNSAEFKCEDDGYIDINTIDRFVDWLIDNNIWHGNVLE